MGDLEPGEPRYWFWAQFSGGDRSRPYRVDFGPPCHGSGCYTRYAGDQPRGLLRYDRQGNMSGSASLGRDGRWHYDERPARNVWRGSDYGDEVTPDEARTIAAQLGHDQSVIDDPAVIRDDGT